MAVTGWKAPQTVANVDRDGNPYWDTVDNVKTDDSNYSACTPDKADYSDWLRTTNFGFSTLDIPEGSTIDGIEYAFKRAASTTDIIQDSAIYLRKSTGQVGDNKASAARWIVLPGVEFVSYGGAADDWNAGLTDSDIRASTFGVDLSALNTDGGGYHIPYVYYCCVRIHYTAPAGENHRRGSFFKMF